MTVYDIAWLAGGFVLGQLFSLFYVGMLASGMFRAFVRQVMSGGQDRGE